VPSLLVLALLFPGFIYTVMKDELVRGRCMVMVVVVGKKGRGGRGVFLIVPRFA
jgi:hypothetical protein